MKSWNRTGVLQKSGVVRNIIGERHSIFKTRSQPLFVGQNSCRSSQEQRGSAELLLYVLWVWAQGGFLLSSLDSFASVGEQGFLSGSECAVHSKRLLLCWKIYPALTNWGKTTNSAQRTGVNIRILTLFLLRRDEPETRRWWNLYVSVRMNKPGLQKHPSLLTYLSSLPTTTKRWKMAPSLWLPYGEAWLQSEGDDPARFGIGQMKPGPQYAMHVKETYWSYLSVDSPKAPCSFFTVSPKQTVQCAAVMPRSQLHYFSFCLSHNKALHHIYEQSVNLDFDSEIFARSSLVRSPWQRWHVCVCVSMINLFSGSRLSISLLEEELKLCRGI